MKNPLKRSHPTTNKSVFFFLTLTALMLVAVGTGLAGAPRKSVAAVKSQVAAASVAQSFTGSTAPEMDAPVGANFMPPRMLGRVTVMVEMEGVSASVAYAEAYHTALAAADAQRQYALTHPKDKVARAAVNRIQTEGVQISSSAASTVVSQVKALDSAQQAVLPALTGGSIGGEVVFRTQRVYNGIALNVEASKMAEISKLPGVKAVHIMTPKSPAAFSDIDFIGVRSFWTKTVPFGGVHGENVKVADIDTGLDYVHTDFGGNGDYTGVDDTHTAGKFPNAKVPGGYDFA
ncbi:MAG: hypothetical protein M3R10_01360, partial [Verrucomicrobiota bacterium]|nr:hypothetical protein [Verrucomicrobiota bacterium]